MSGLCEGRVVIVTGAGRGIGRAHALSFAAEGAAVVVNDVGADVDGSGSSTGPAAEVVRQITDRGGRAVISGHDVADETGARALVATAVDEFGRLDVLVNNAGILRDRMLVNMSFEEWDAVIRVHLRGTFGPSHAAAQHWRERSKAGEEVSARIINTSSPSGIYGNVGQSNYGAAKAGIASFTVIAAMELARYGVTVNAIAPVAATRMTIPLSTEGAAGPGPEDISPLVVWLGSEQSAGVTGRVFNVRGGRISVAEGWHAGPGVSREGHWQPDELGEVVTELVRQAQPNADMAGRVRDD
jgi:NAD(P)-dependent dehydrogenase (short-subunit alcohol dehydrogenase family)